MKKRLQKTIAVAFIFAFLLFEAASTQAFSSDAPRDLNHSSSNSVYSEGTKKASRNIVNSEAEILSYSSKDGIVSLTVKCTKNQYVDGVNIYRKAEDGKDSFKFVGSAKKTSKKAKTIKYTEKIDVSGSYSYMAEPYCTYKKKDYLGDYSCRVFVNVLSEKDINEIDEINQKNLSKYHLENLKEAKSFGLAEDFGWISDMSADDALENNILYCYLVGNYALDLAVPNGFASHTAIFIKNYIEQKKLMKYCDLTGPFINCHVDVKTTVMKNYSIIHVDYFNFADQPHEAAANIYKKMANAQAELKKAYDKIHAAGHITDKMSELDIVRWYYDNLGNYVSTKVGSGNELFYETGSIAGPFSAYGSCCGAFSSVFTHMLHLEGIEAWSEDADTYISGELVSGHVLSAAKCDGKEYLIDYGNRCEPQINKGKIVIQDTEFVVKH